MLHSPNIPVSSNRSWFLVLSAVAFVGVMVFSLYYALRVSSIKKELAALEEKQKSLMAASAQETATPEGRYALTTIKDYLQKIQTNQTLWSKMVETINETIPKNTDTNEPTITVRSYNGSQEGKITLSAVTKTTAKDPFTDVAELIHAFTAKSAFKNVFVPSITKNLLPDGTTVLNFSVNFEYQKQTF